MLNILRSFCIGIAAIILLVVVPVHVLLADADIASFDTGTNVLFVQEVIVDQSVIYQDVIIHIDLDYGTARLIKAVESVVVADDLDCGPQFGPPIEIAGCDNY